MQVDPIKLTLKAPGIKRLKPTYDKAHLNFAFKLNLRPYAMILGERMPELDIPLIDPTSSRTSNGSGERSSSTGGQTSGEGSGQGLTLVHVRAQLEQLQDAFMS